MKKFGTKLVAVATATAMTFAFSPIVSLAETTGGEKTASPAEGSSTGNGKVEDVLEKDVFDVVLPTIDTEKDETFNFILDPQNLIKTVGETDKYDATFTGTGGLYFKNADAVAESSTKAQYSGTSNKLKIVNKSTGSVDVSINATVADADGLTFATAEEQAAEADEESTLTGIDKMTSNSIYLDLILDNKDNAPKKTVFTGNGATASLVIPAAENAYKVTYDSGESKYKYAIDTDTYADDDAFYDAGAGAVLSMSGECNKNPDVDWTALKDITPSVTVAWTVSKHVDKPVFTTGSAAGTISYVAGAGDKALKTIKSVTLLYEGTPFDGYNANFDWADATDDGSTITLDSVFLAYFAGDSTEATITYETTDDTEETATVTVNLK